MRTRLLLPILFPVLLAAQTPAPRWTITKPGEIGWRVKADDPHADHIEMSGEQVSLWVKYAVDSLQSMQMQRTVIFPNFRMKPNDTHGTLMAAYSDSDLPRFYIGMTPLRPTLISGYMRPGVGCRVSGVGHNGIMQVTSELERVERGKVTAKLTLKQYLFPSATEPAAVERFVFINNDSKPCQVSMEYLQKEIKTDTLHSTGGPHFLYEYTIGDGIAVVQPGDSAAFAVVYQAVRNGEQLVKLNPAYESAGRMARVRDVRNPIRLITPDPVLNNMFTFAKQRAGESVYQTKNGYINSPGGLRYHAAIWANDQAEYTGPWFGYAGYPLGEEAALNAYRWFAKFMNKDFKPIPSSIIAEGIDYWDGAGDRGDQAMIAYGASRFALSTGNIDIARELWPLIEYCLEFSRRKVNADGVVESDSDELEGRFPAGKANLCTSTLYYDALISASALTRELGMPKQLSDKYMQQALKLKTAIGKYFGATVEGYETYRYYKENTVLRSWICMPLTVGIFDRAAGTVDALFSPRLWTVDGLATQAGDKTFWDRSTLYGLRGVFAAGETARALDYLKKYSERRLLGVHVPYAVEAWPEGNQTQLSGESALYCRVLTEGLFGLRPAGLRAFEITPRLPEGWNEMALENVSAFGNTFDILVTRKGKSTEIRISRHNREPIVKNWDGKGSIRIEFAEKAGAPKAGDATFPAQNPWNRHDAKAAAVKAGNFDLFCIGNSITQCLEGEGDEWKPLRASWEKYLVPLNAINLGYSGYRTENILWNLQNGELGQAKPPKVAMLLIGTNNLDDQHYKMTHTAEEVFAGTKSIVDLIHQKYPSTKVLILRVFSCGGPGDITPYSRKYNRSQQAMDATLRAGLLTRQLANGRDVFWLDINPVFLRPDGTIDPGLMPDLIHPNGPGAEAWVGAVEPVVKRLMR